METLMQVSQGSFELKRLPQRKNEKLRAWDAADEYLLKYISENLVLSATNKILILNDTFGALAIALNSNRPIAISDSYLSQQATRQNFTENHLSQEKVQLRNSLDWPRMPMDLVLIKVPKTLALLEDQLIRLTALVTEKTTVIAAGMVKAMPSAVWKLIERYLGSTKPSLAKKKARLIFISLDTKQKSVKTPYPVYYRLEDTRYRICNHANVFSRDSLDIGTRFLLKHLPENTQAKDIVDLGCGNGVVGLMLAQNHSGAYLSFVDESYMAITSAQENFQQAFAQRKADFFFSDGLTAFKTESMDLIVCNPPFHQQNTVGNQIALSMFRQSRRVLRKDGELWVIGNRHLAYHIDLKHLFRVCNEIASNTKFVIWQVKK